MKEYVWALHDFQPQISDEVPFRAGERIEVVEKDDLYQDGWWKGINPQGREGLFPRSYTTDKPPAADASRQIAFPDQDVAAALPVVDEESEQGANAARTPSNGVTDERERTLSHGEAAMQATLTDVQKAIEQLGRNNDADGSRSFSFRSSHDEYTDRSDTGTDAESEAEDGANWHRNAREKLAIRAQQENEQRLKDAASIPPTPMRIAAPPINVEFSDESDDEDEEQDKATLKTQRRHSEGIPESHYEHQYPHIPEEEEEEEEDITEEAAEVPPPLGAGPVTQEDRNATIVPSLPSAAQTIPIPSILQPMPSPDSDGRPHDIP